MAPTKRLNHLFYNLLLFGRVLRGVGVQVDPGRMIDTARALELAPIGSRDAFYYTLRGILVRRREDLPLFDRAFEQFWRAPGSGQQLRQIREPCSFGEPELGRRQRGGLAGGRVEGD